MTTAMRILRTTAPVVTVTSDELEQTVAFYEQLIGESARARLKNPAGTLDLVLVNTMLVIGGSPAALEPRRALKATFIVDSVAEWRTALIERGATIIEEPALGPVSGQGPIGRFMFVRHPDGNVFEYFEPTLPPPARS